MLKVNRDNSEPLRVARSLLEIVIEFITRRKCSKCKFNMGLTCNSPRYEECASKIYPVGFERKKR